ncbi:uncharacterized protein LOC114300760 [Camellia sinensis]|uniref:uncharacterized protein LOC114300760 n=1 Tax=Camellia sinensis TaxID=4442 RepID=UPI0010361028|nr:uncharacterized protein LOC114300760 [Camellia sinensis]
MDGVLIANEVVDWWKKSKKNGLILKLDFQKAYDTVNWNWLNILLSRAKELRIIIGMAVGDREVNISHLQFADDTIIFSKVDWAEIVAVKRNLRCFEVVSGLKINFYKSMICGVGVEDGLVEEFAAKLNCLSHKLPLKYFGLLLGANPDEALWKSMICAKYGVSGCHWFPPLNDLVSISIIWRDALAVSYLNLRLYNFYVENVELRISDGNRVKFWNDIWMRTSSLKSQFPRLYQLNLENEITLKMQISCRDSTNKWCFNFRRPLFGWKKDECDQLLQICYSDLAAVKLCLFWFSVV